MVSFSMVRASLAASDSMEDMARSAPASQPPLASSSAPSAQTTMAPARRPFRVRSGATMARRQRRRSLRPAICQLPTSRSNSLHSPSGIEKHLAPAGTLRTGFPAGICPRSAATISAAHWSSAAAVRSSTPMEPMQARRPSASRSNRATRVKTLFSATVRQTRCASSLAALAESVPALAPWFSEASRRA